MMYLRYLRESFDILRSTKVIWPFVFLSLTPMVLVPLESFVRTHRSLACLYGLTILPLMVVSIMGYMGLIRMAHEAASKRPGGFLDIWSLAKSKFWRVLGAMALAIPAYLPGQVVSRLISRDPAGSPCLWLAYLLNDPFTAALPVFVISAIMLDDLKAGPAAWTGFLITINNLFRVIVIYWMVHLPQGILILLTAGLLHLTVGLDIQFPLTFDLPGYFRLLAVPSITAANWVLTLVLFPLETILLMLAYAKFSRDIKYPALEGHAAL